MCAISLDEECFQIELKHKFILLMNAKELVDYVWWHHVRIIQVNITCPMSHFQINQRANLHNCTLPISK
jgi:hypothetical protein